MLLKIKHGGDDLTIDTRLEEVRHTDKPWLSIVFGDLEASLADKVVEAMLNPQNHMK